LVVGDLTENAAKAANLFSKGGASIAGMVLIRATLLVLDKLLKY
jgi:hypothetical protein